MLVLLISFSCFRLPFPHYELSMREPSHSLPRILMGWFTDLKEKLHPDKGEEIEVSDKAVQSDGNNVTPSALQASATQHENVESEPIAEEVEVLSEIHVSTPVTAKAIADVELPKAIGKDEAPALETVARDLPKDSGLAPAAIETYIADSNIEEARQRDVSALAYATTGAAITPSHSRQSSSDTITPGKPGRDVSVVTETPLAKTVSTIAEAGTDTDSNDVISPASSKEITPKAPLPRVAVAKAPRNLSLEAFNVLDPNIQAQIRTLLPELDLRKASVPVDFEIKALMAIVKTKQETCEKKFWRIKVHGQDVVIRDYVNASVNIIEKAGDVAINFAPAPGSTVWSGVKTLIQVCSYLVVCSKPARTERGDRWTPQAKPNSVLSSQWLRALHLFCLESKHTKSCSPKPIRMHML